MSTYLYDAFDCMVLLFQSEFTPYSSLNVKELIARNRRGIWTLSDSNRIHNITPVSSKEFLDIHATIDCRFTLKRVRDMMITVKCTVQISTHNTAILFKASLAKWLSVRLRTKCRGFASRCCHLNLAGNYLFKVNNGNARTIWEYYLNHSNLFISDWKHSFYIIITLVLPCEICLGCYMI